MQLIRRLRNVASDGDPIKTFAVTSCGYVKLVPYTFNVSARLLVIQVCSLRKQQITWN